MLMMVYCSYKEISDTNWNALLHIFMQSFTYLHGISIEISNYLKSY